MKLLLIEPASQLVTQKKKFQILENIARKEYFDVPPLALGVLAGLTPPDWEIKIIQEPRDMVNFDEKADLVGITAVTHTAKRGYEIADEFRKREINVIMGGIHPTVMFKEALEHCDSVCVGEAETIWKDVLEDFKHRKLKKIYKPLELFDLRFYTSLRRDLMSKHKSLFFNIGDTIEASRGCPYNCDFCSVSLIHGRKIRYRPVNNLIPEIESIENDKLFFVDNNIIANFHRAKELFHAMIPLKKRWTGQATISIVKDRELLKLASDSGCYGLLIGIESVIDEGFNKYNKNPNSYFELKRALKILKDHGIGVLAHMVFGNDFDSKQTILGSLERLFELDIASATLGIIVPYPGTKLAMDLEKKNRILTKDWNYYDIHHLVFQPINFICEDFLKDMENLRKRFFSIKAIVSRTLNYRSLTVLGFNISSRFHNKVNYALGSELV